jgi:hypothetical protein
MAPRVCLYSVPILIAACGQTSPSGSPIPNQASSRETQTQDYSFCGATTTKERIDEYFDQLARFLETPGDRSRLRSLIGEHVVVVESGRSRTVPASVFVEARPYLISVADWAEISRRGEPRLVGAGWRGCFLSHGKAAFEVDEGGHLHLSSFNLDMTWDRDARPR